MIYINRGLPESIAAPSLTKLEYFAIQALQGLLANPRNTNFAQSDLADEAVLAAQALLDRLAKDRESGNQEDI